MIAEDYVSFETAQLLRDKGFDEYISVGALGRETVEVAAEIGF